MHYYQFNIGDYASHTRHLSLMENLAYRLLLDHYYLHERPLNVCLTDVARSINMREYVAEIEIVLNEFFELDPAIGWINKRADEEIAKYHAKSKSASKAGKASAATRLNKRSTDAEQTLNTNSTDVQPNIKQETRNNKQSKATSLGKPSDVTDQVWADFLTLRKAKRAPVTETVIDGIRKDAMTINITLDDALKFTCKKGWQSFNPEWYQNSAGAQKKSDDLFADAT